VAKIAVPIRLEGRVHWDFAVSKSSQGYVAICDPLHLTAEGETFDELLRDIQGVTNDLFAHLYKEGALEKFLRGLGWTEHRIFIPDGLSIEDVVLDVPFSLDAKSPEQLDA
jgi:predicted RNase H-like HicB family nuclease